MAVSEGIELAPLTFTEAGVDQALAMVQEPEFMKATLVAIEERDMALSDLHGRVMAEVIDPERGDMTIAFRRAAGYLVAYRVLEIAAAPGDLMVVGDRLARGYERRIAANPADLDGDVARDYQPHPVAGEYFLGKKLTNDASRYGAMVMLALHGRQANPGREPIFLPDEPVRATGSKRQLQQERRRTQGR